MNNILEYSYIRTEENNSYTLFLIGAQDWVGVDLDLSINAQHQLVLKVPANEGETSSHISEAVPPLLLLQLQRHETDVVLCNKNADFLASIRLPPLGAEGKQRLQEQRAQSLT